MLMRIRKRKLPILFLTGVGILWPLLAASFVLARELKINLIAVNATDSVKEIDVKYPMPKELEPSDILNTGDLKLTYDVDLGTYLVHGKQTFQPKETKKFQIVINDVWEISEQEIDMLKKQLDDNLKSMEDHENYEQAKRARDIYAAQLDGILAGQQRESGDIQKRIEEHRASMAVLNNLRSKIYDVDFLKHQSAAIYEAETKKRSIKLNIQVQNPSEFGQTIELKHYLPDRIRPGHVLDKKDFDIRFDEEKNRSFLTKQEVFKPKEEKKYEIVIEDIWHFNERKVDDLSDRTILGVNELKDTPYFDSAEFLKERIMQNLDKIRLSNVDKQDIKEHIGIFLVNEKRYEEAWNDFKRIEEMIAIVRAKKLKEFDQGKVQNILKKLQALRGLSALADALFKKTISITVTWRIIMGTIAFVAFFTTLHFFIWAKRSKTMGEEMAPKSGEGIKVVPKPGTEEKPDE